jgi:hypothetical protein
LSVSNEIESGIRELCDMLKVWLIAALERQGHKATGDLINSIDVALEKAMAGMSIVGKFVYYGRFVDTGRRAGITGVPVDELIKWIRVKNIDLRGRKERDVAFAMMFAIKKKGIPSNGAQDKKRFMSGVLEEHETEIFNMIDTAFYNLFEGEINNLVEKTQTEINSIQYHA